MPETTCNYMDKDKSAVESFLGELATGENSFEETPKDPFDKQEIVEPKEEVEVKEEKPLPFHKDPKVQKYIEREISDRLANFKPEPAVVTQPADDETTDVLTRLIGNDTPEKVSMIKEFKNILEKGTERAKKEALAEIEARQYEEVEADREAEAELENAFDTIEETFDVDITSSNALARKTRQEFVSFVEKIAPKDRNGDIVDYPDMLQAYEAFSELKKSTATPSRAKELASRGMARSAETTTTPQKRPTWDAADEFISSLK